MSPGLAMVGQRSGEAENAAPWILDRDGQRMEGRDDSRRAKALEEGLLRHPAVRSFSAETTDREVERVLSRLHEERYLQALRAVDWDEPRMTPEWAPPGLPADSPVWSGIVATAFEGVRTAVAAGQRVLAGERFAYAVCRPPGHHAGPSWMGGYCYLNTAAAAAQAIRDGGLRPVTILDLDFHFPTGTAAVVDRMLDVKLHSLHASTLQQVPWAEVHEREHERFVGFLDPPDTGAYIAALADALAAMSDSEAVVVSLGYDTVAGDPHGEWSFPVETFAQIGRLLAESGLPVCVVQEGGYALEALADCSHAFACGLLGDESP